MSSKHLLFSLCLLAALQVYGFFYLGDKIELQHQQIAQTTHPTLAFALDTAQTNNTQTAITITEQQLQNLLQRAILQTRSELHQANQQLEQDPVETGIVSAQPVIPVDQAKNLSAVTHTQELIGQALTSGRWTKADAQIWNEQRDFLSNSQRISIMEPILEAWERNELELEPEGFPLF